MGKPEQEDALTLQQKLRKIAETADAIQKSKEGYGYRYVPEPEVLAVITGALNKYHVNIIPQINPGTLTVTPLRYEKMNRSTKQLVPVNEVLVQGEMIYKFVNSDNPAEEIEVPWAFVAQMEDAAQAFGSALTYANRYALVKIFQIATTDTDPDEYRSKQKQAEDKEELEAKKQEAEALEKKIKEVVDRATALIGKGSVDKNALYAIVAEHNEGRKNPNSIKDIESCEKILAAFSGLENPDATKQAKPKQAKKEAEQK